MWTYFYTCLRVPFNRWEHSRAHRTIDLTETWVLWQLQLTVILPKMQYKQISRLGKYGIIFIHAPEYHSIGGSTAGAVGAIRRMI